jgi:hypothetical protein
VPIGADTPYPDVATLVRARPPSAGPFPFPARFPPPMSMPEPRGKPDPSAPLWTIAETAACLELSEESIRRTIADHRLGCVPIGPRGGRIRIRPAHVEAYLRSADRPATRVAPQAAASQSSAVRRRDPGPVHDFFAKREVERARKAAEKAARASPAPSIPAPSRDYFGPPPVSAEQRGPATTPDRQAEHDFRQTWVRVEHFAELDKVRAESRAARGARKPDAGDSGSRA